MSFRRSTPKQVVAGGRLNSFCHRFHLRIQNWEESKNEEREKSIYTLTQADGNYFVYYFVTEDCKKLVLLWGFFPSRSVFLSFALLWVYDTSLVGSHFYGHVLTVCIPTVSHAIEWKLDGVSPSDDKSLGLLMFRTASVEHSFESSGLIHSVRLQGLSTVG